MKTHYQGDAWLREVPESVLEILDIQHNKIALLPEQMCKLSNLCYLLLGGNKLDKLPIEIKNLSKLIYLILHTIIFNPFE
jgi:Leucine-rich repeat (LRR) protein